MQARKVALFLPNLAGGGAERVALALATALSAEGLQVDLLLVRKEGELLPLLPRSVRVLELGGSRIGRSLLPLIRYLRSEKPFALHAFMWPLTIIALVARAAAGVPARIVVSDHTTLSKHGVGRRERRLMRWTMRLLYPSADARIQVSSAAADDLADLSGIDRASIEVVANPVSPPSRVGTTPNVEKLWCAGPGERILSVGSLKETKDHALLIRAFARLRRPGARLMIVGEGTERARLEALAATLGVADRVIMPGFALDPWPFYASADIFVLSSRLEGQPLVLMEAVASGMRVVSTDCPSGPREILDNGRFGRLVPVGDELLLAQAIDTALAEPADPARQRARAAELAHSGSMARHLELLLG